MIHWRRVAFLAAAVALAASAAWLRLGPIDEALLDQGRFASVTVVDRNGVVLYEPLSSVGTRGEALSGGALPKQLVHATLAAEDRRFFIHPGVDVIAVARAAFHDIARRKIVEGGSTLTQQTAKLLLTSGQGGAPARRSVRRKIEETILALRLEHRFDKRAILAMYLNIAPYGNRIHGVSRASTTYFGCAPDELTTAQAAFLAALPQRPTAYNPLRDASPAIERQRRVLKAMRLTPVEFEQALRERLRFNSAEQPLIAQHFVERVLETAARSGRAAVIRTTLDAALQRDVQGIISAQRKRLLAHGAKSVAVAVLDNRSGEWLAWEGSGDYFGDDFGGAIDGVITPRQPGSTLKPFTYAVGFEQGFSPASVLPDVPSHFPTAEQGIVYTPRNYDGKYRGPLPIRAALGNSENVPAVAMLARITPAAMLRALRAAGFTDLKKSADYYGLGLTLGDAEVRLDQLVAGYAAFARGGLQIEPHMIAGQRSGRIPGRLFTPRTAFWISDILSDPAAREYAFGSGGSLDFPFRVAVKTGTSQAYRDNWTVGYTRDVTVGVWVGNFDRATLRNSSGVTGAAPIFNSVMLAAVRRVRGFLPIGDDDPIVAQPPTVESLPICATSGLRPSPYCPSVRSEWLPLEQPAEFCSWHHDGRTDWPAEYRDWAAASAPPDMNLVQERRSAKQTRNTTLRITNPADGATFLIDPTLRSAFQKLDLRAVSDVPVRWEVDSDSLPGSEWALQRGRHSITATDGRGNRQSVEIFVK